MAETKSGLFGGWKFDKNIPVSLVLVVLGQTLAFGLWMGRIEERVADLEDRVSVSSSLQARTIRIEVMLEGLTARMNREAERRDGP